MSANLLWNWLPATCVMVAISLVYFATDKSVRLGSRLVSSAHGLLGAAIFSGAMAAWSAGWSSASLSWPFTLLFLLPIASIFGSLALRQGSRLVHLLLVPELACLAWAWFVGGMAATNDWL